MLNLAVYYNSKPSIKPEALRIIEQLRRAGYKLSIEKVFKNTQLVLALGGDGTFLRTAEALKRSPLPLLPVSLGRLGFMGELGKTEVLNSLNLFQKGQFILDKRYFLEVSVFQKEKLIYTDSALNDIVLSRAGISRLFDLKITAQKKETVFRADGIIISTPTGSTAYNLSAGGPIFPPDTKKYILTPICPHLIDWQSIVVEDKYKTTVQPLSVKNIKLFLTYDGHKVKEIFSDNVSLEIKKAINYVSFIRFKPYAFAEIFKLKFGKAYPEVIS